MPSAKEAIDMNMEGPIINCKKLGIVCRTKTEERSWLNDSKGSMRKNSKSKNSFISNAFFQGII
jgi:hypothetical protein